jgi:hypothetical protein
MTLFLIDNQSGVLHDGGKKRDLSELAGTWDDERYGQFEESIRALGVVDEDMWNT